MTAQQQLIALVAKRGAIRVILSSFEGVEPDDYISPILGAFAECLANLDRDIQELKATLALDVTNEQFLQRRTLGDDQIE